MLPAPSQLKLLHVPELQDTVEGLEPGHHNVCPSWRPEQVVGRLLGEGLEQLDLTSLRGPHGVEGQVVPLRVVTMDHCKSYSLGLPSKGNHFLSQLHHVHCNLLRLHSEQLKVGHLLFVLRTLGESIHLDAHELTLGLPVHLDIHHAEQVLLCDLLKLNVPMLVLHKPRQHHTGGLISVFRHPVGDNVLTWGPIERADARNEEGGCLLWIRLH
mmetsp:Transcript_62954/g.112299  ORF Transcript_62954/g.112299 Transcript_62954/m.112299 type:complete len:213 (-) Transcript_62954:882-1520(-)